MNRPGELEHEQSLAAMSAAPSAVVGSIDGRVLVAVLLQAAAIAFVAMVATSSRTPTMRRPWEPLLISAVALSLAQCSLGGIWWARTKWPLHLKTLVAIVACTAVWGMLLAVLDESRGQPDRAAGWAAAFATQFGLTALLSAAIELWIGLRRSGQKHQYSILSLLLWMTLIGCLLAFGRWIAVRFGWTPATFFSWEYFRHLQTIALANATLAVAVFACVRLITSRHRRTVACASLLTCAVPITIWAMWSLFGRNLGASLTNLAVTNLAVLSIVHGVFLAVTLLLLEPVNEKQPSVG